MTGSNPSLRNIGASVGPPVCRRVAPIRLFGGENQTDEVPEWTLLYRLSYRGVCPCPKSSEHRTQALAPRVGVEPTTHDLRSNPDLRNATAAVVGAGENQVAEVPFGEKYPQPTQRQHFIYGHGAFAPSQPPSRS